MTSQNLRSTYLDLILPNDWEKLNPSNKYTLVTYFIFIQVEQLAKIVVRAAQQL